MNDVKRVTWAVPLNDAQRDTIMRKHTELCNTGAIPDVTAIEQASAMFRERFGPAVLASLKGEDLLTLMHDHSNRESLVYWLEFKKNDEFQTWWFGSIAGGSALKFRLFRRQGSGAWQTTGKKANQPKEITPEQAIVVAQQHREQLLRGVRLLEQLPSMATDKDYAQLQDQMDELAPDVSRLAWGHKYFSLLFSDKLDCFHHPDWQRFYLRKLLQLPPDGEGRYITAGRFVAVAQQTGMTLNHTWQTLDSLYGQRYRYWRIGTTVGKDGDSFWPMMRDRGCIAVGWPKLGDLSLLNRTDDFLGQIKSRMLAAYPNTPSAIGNDASQVAQLVHTIREGDIVLAAEGMKIHGIGRVTGAYQFHPEFGFPHQRAVEWLNLEPWKLPHPKDGLQSTVRELKKSRDNLLAIEQQLQGIVPQPAEPSKLAKPTTIASLPGHAGRIQSILKRKGQVILYGPPGTGKTYWAVRAARDLAALHAFGRPFESCSSEEQQIIGQPSGLVRWCCFHPAYGYEDFLEGYRPESADQKLGFVLRDGIFKKLCADAQQQPDRNFYLIVDEINRGDIPRIFGELLTALELNKRGQPFTLPLSQQLLVVPRNVFLLGTMNTADRSISLLDVALRRRFGFVELMPDHHVLGGAMVEQIPLGPWLSELNTRIRQHVGRDARNLQIGHSYLMDGEQPLRDIVSFKQALRDDIIPLLEEYCYEDYRALSRILGGLVEDSQERIKSELFADGQEQSLVEAILATFRSLSISSEAITVDTDDVDDDDIVVDEAAE